MKQAILGLMLSLLSLLVHAERIKDIAQISGIRTNQLIGYGLVVGLDGSGDSGAFTKQSFTTLLSRLGIQLPAGTTADSKNIAAVAIHAVLPAFAQAGQVIDVTVSSIGSAKSLRGGTLLLSPLRGADNQVYAIAQGNLIVGGFGAEGKDGSKIKVNVPVVGRIPGGATIEKASPSRLLDSDHITYLINRPDFTTARRISEIINQYMGPNTAVAQDAAAIKVSIPHAEGERIEFLSVLENLTITPGADIAKIIVNSRTGTIVIGQHVKIAKAAVTHGSLTVTIKENDSVSQPLPDSEGTTTQINNSSISISQEKNRLFTLPESNSLENIVTAVNQVGAAPGDLMAILEALKQAGALSAELEII